ncbi:hypothetical protein [Paraburkholderia nemoris]|nr:hypothetical protein [Paraburkholderia nemoris]CAE6804914.1 hypothetical protein LMG22931_05582 [Paraburkholderia nemoris]
MENIIIESIAANQLLTIDAMKSNASNWVELRQTAPEARNSRRALCTGP